MEKIKKFYGKYFNQSLDEDATLVLCIVLLFPIFSYLFRVISNNLGIKEFWLSSIIYLTILFVYSSFIYHYSKVVLPRMIKVIGLYVVVMILNYIIFPANRMYYFKSYLMLRQIVIIYIPAGVIISCIKDYEKSFEALRKASYIGIPAMILSIILGYFNYFGYMLFGVHLLPFAMISAYYAYKMRNRLDVLFAMISFLLIMFMAGRASLVTLIFYFVILVIARLKKRPSKQRKRLYFYIGIGASLLLLFWRPLLTLVNSILVSVGISSRNLQLLLEGNAGNLLYRDHYYEFVSKAIHQNIFALHGIFGDRVILDARYPNVSYVHNIVLEIQVTFGFLLGNLVLLILMYALLTSFLKGKQAKKQLIFFMACVVLPRLMISSSFMIEGNFYLFLGIIFADKLTFDKTEIKNIVYPIFKFPLYFINMVKYSFSPLDIKVMGINETVDYINKNEASMVRFGDGELMIMNGENISNYQNSSPVLAKELQKIIQEDKKDLLVCLPDVFSGLYEYKFRTRYHWITELNKKKDIYLKFTQESRIYGNAFVTRPYIMFNNKEKSKDYFEHIRRLWEKRRIILVEGKFSRFSVGNDLLDNALETKRILCPPNNAFEKFEEILKACLEFDKDHLFMVSLGPAAKPLVYQLYKLGYRAIDIGHLDSEYEWYLAGAETRTKIKNKHTAEMGDSEELNEVSDKKYLLEISTVIN